MFTTLHHCGIHTFISEMAHLKSLRAHRVQKCSNLIEKSVLVVNRQSSFLLLRAEYEFDYNEQYFIVVFYLVRL